MNLSDSVILYELNTGRIVIDPFDRKYLNPNSVDLTLAPTFKVYTRRYTEVENFSEIPEDIRQQGLYNSHIRVNRGRKTFYRYEEPLDCRRDNPVEERAIPEHGYVLSPGEVYLYACNERIGCFGDIRAKVEGKSSLGRLGLFIHVTAGFIDTGFCGSLVLELVATRPIRIYPNMKICQVEFTRVEGDVKEAYGDKPTSKYMNQEGVQQSKMHENFHPDGKGDLPEAIAPAKRPEGWKPEKRDIGPKNPPKVPGDYPVA